MKIVQKYTKLEPIGIRWNGWMSGGYYILHVGLYVSMVRCDTENYLKKSSVTSTLVVNKSALQIFNPMVVLYQKINERIFYYVPF